MPFPCLHVNALKRVIYKKTKQKRMEGKHWRQFIIIDRWETGSGHSMSTLMDRLNFAGHSDLCWLLRIVCVGTIKWRRVRVMNGQGVNLTKLGLVHTTRGLIEGWARLAKYTNKTKLPTMMNAYGELGDGILPNRKSTHPFLGSNSAMNPGRATNEPLSWRWCTPHHALPLFR